MDSERVRSQVEAGRRLRRTGVAPFSTIVATQHPDLGPSPQSSGEGRVDGKNGKPNRNHPEADDGQEADDPHGDEAAAHGNAKKPASRQVHRPAPELHSRHGSPFLPPRFSPKTGPGQIGKRLWLFKGRHEKVRENTAPANGNILQGQTVRSEISARFSLFVSPFHFPRRRGFANRNSFVIRTATEAVPR